MKRLVIILALAIMGYCSNSLSMPLGHNGKADQEQQQTAAAAQANQAYRALGQELRERKPNEVALTVLTAKIVEEMDSLKRSQRIDTVIANATTNKMHAEFKTKKQQKLHSLSEKGEEIVRLLTLVTTGPEGACSADFIKQLIQKGIECNQKAIANDCMLEPEKFPCSEKFYALLQHPKIKPFATQGLQPQA